MISLCPCKVTTGEECRCALVAQRGLDEGPCARCNAFRRRWPLVVEVEGKSEEVELCRACWCAAFGVNLGALAALRDLLGHTEFMERRIWDRHWANCGLCGLVVRVTDHPGPFLKAFRALGRVRDLTPRWNRRGLRRVETDVGDRDPEGCGDPFVFWGVVENGYSAAPDGLRRRVVEAYEFEEAAAFDARIRSRNDGDTWWVVPLTGDSNFDDDLARVLCFEAGRETPSAWVMSPGVRLSRRSWWLGRGAPGVPLSDSEAA